MRPTTADVLSGFHQVLSGLAPSFLRGAYQPASIKTPHFTVDLIPSDHDQTFDGTLRNYRVQVTAWVQDDLAAALALSDSARVALEERYFCLSGPAMTDDGPWFGAAYDFQDIV